MTLAAEDGCDRPAFDGKKAQNGFLSLLEKNKKANINYTRASEYYRKKGELLDELIALHEDNEQKKAGQGEREEETRGGRGKEHRGARSCNGVPGQTSERDSRHSAF
ncbi:hypothetical protein PybrP1_004463 [[Pythium] brassicae (nom. inval.)]|nr:hypothetical protein PybrP1_004463 [[Pythium] brassicae (nom. inval.)]